MAATLDTDRDQEALSGRDRVPTGAGAGRSPHRRFAAAFARHRWPILVFLETRVLLLAVAAVNGALRHHGLVGELSHWDGLWYARLGLDGYPDRVLHRTSALGFFPLYPLVIWPLAHFWLWITPVSTTHALEVAGVIVSGIGGLVSAVFVQRLAASWWGEQTARRAVVLYCLFPGSVVFSMVYAEGLALPLVAGCLLALQRRRWLLAGVLAGFATAVEPEAIVLVIVCATSALLELRRRGWRTPAGVRSLIAPLLSLTGIGAFAVYLWAHTGTPFAYTQAQHYGWNEKTDPFALVHLARSLANEISFSHFNHPTINLNLVVGLAGAILLLVLLVLLFMRWRQVSVEALVWTLGVSILAVSAEYTPPNPRLLITAFPAVIVLAYYVKGRAFVWLSLANGALLVGLSALTFVGTTLRP